MSSKIGISKFNLFKLQTKKKKKKKNLNFYNLIQKKNFKKNFQ